MVLVMDIPTRARELVEHRNGRLGAATTLALGWFGLIHFIPGRYLATIVIAFLFWLAIRPGIQTLPRRQSPRCNPAELSQVQTTVMCRLDMQDAVIRREMDELRSDVLTMVGDREQRVEEFFERLEGVSDAFGASLKELRREW